MHVLRPRRIVLHASVGWTRRSKEEERRKTGSRQKDRQTGRKEGRQEGRLSPRAISVLMLTVGLGDWCLLRPRTHAAATGCGDGSFLLSLGCAPRLQVGRSHARVAFT